MSDEPAKFRYLLPYHDFYYRVKKWEKDGKIIHFCDVRYLDMNFNFRLDPLNFHATVFTPNSAFPLSPNTRSLLIEFMEALHNHLFDQPTNVPF